MLHSMRLSQLQKLKLKRLVNTMKSLGMNAQMQEERQWNLLEQIIKAHRKYSKALQKL